MAPEQHSQPRRSHPRRSAPVERRRPLDFIAGYTTLVVDTNILLALLPNLANLIESKTWTVVVPLPGKLYYMSAKCLLADSCLQSLRNWTVWQRTPVPSVTPPPKPCHISSPPSPAPSLSKSKPRAATTSTASPSAPRIPSLTVPAYAIWTI